MLAVAFDTLKLARKLESAGFPSKQAQDASAALAECFGEWQGSANLATHEDVQKSERELKSDVQKLSDDLKNTEARLKTHIAENKTDIIKWVVGIGFGQIALILAALKLHF